MFPLFHGVVSCSFCFLQGAWWEEGGRGRPARGLLGNRSLSHQVGFMKTGKIVALEVEHYSNAGNSLDLSHGVSRASSCTSE